MGGVWCCLFCGWWHLMCKMAHRDPLVALSAAPIFFPLLQVGIEEMCGLVAASQGKGHNLASLRGSQEEEEEETFVHVYCLLHMF